MATEILYETLSMLRNIIYTCNYRRKDGKNGTGGHVQRMYNGEIIKIIMEIALGVKSKIGKRNLK